MRTSRGLLLLALVIPPVVTKAKIFVTEPDPCFVAEFNAALAKIRASDPLLAQMIARLEASDRFYLVFKSDIITSHDLQNLPGREQYIEWNPDLNIQFPGEGMCIDPVAGLAHELWHKFDIDTHSPEQMNELRKYDISTNGIRKSEINAIHAENLYRFSAGLCNRWQYGKNPLPGFELPEAHCAVLSPQAACPIPPVLPGSCDKSCCYISNYDGKGNSCVKDNLPTIACKALTVPGKQNAGPYMRPCSTTFPSKKVCPF